MPILLVVTLHWYADAFRVELRWPCRRRWLSYTARLSPRPSDSILSWLI